VTGTSGATFWPLVKDGTGNATGCSPSLCPPAGRHAGGLTEFCDGDSVKLAVLETVPVFNERKVFDLLLAPGLYFLEIRAGDFRQRRRIVLQRQKKTRSSRVFF